jgi:hypothetical protein
MKRLTFTTMFVLGATLVTALSSVSFERAARDAHLVVMGRYITDESGRPQFEVSEVLKGSMHSRMIAIREPEWFYFAPEYGNTYLIALDRRRRPLPADSACGTVNILGIDGQYVFKVQDVLAAPGFEEWVRQKVYDFGDGGSRVTVNEMKSLIAGSIANEP